MDYLSCKKESEQRNEEDNEDFQIIFDYVPKMSVYQAVLVTLIGFTNVAAGSIQLAQIILQAKPGKWLMVVPQRVAYNRFQCPKNNQIAISRTDDSS